MRPLSTRIVSLHILLVSHSVGYYWLKRDFCASDFDTIAFSYVSLRIETVFPREKKTDLSCVQRFEQTPKPTAVVVVWRREETR